ncbi:MAG: Ig-like domain-containing protein [Anaerolineae bacterium]
MHKSFARWLWAICVWFIVVGLTGCDRMISLPTATPTSAPEATLTATAAPSATPAPSESPYPPVLLGYEPHAGQEVAAYATPSAVANATAIKLYFDQPMDQASVVAAFRVTPPLEGDFEWPDDATLVFRPRALPAATRYRVTLGGDIRSAAGLPLSTELSFAFSTLTPLVVTHVAPSAGSLDARIDTPALIVFNRAVVPLTCVGKPAQADGECRALSLSFDPAVLGTGMWVETSVYRFDALRGWAAGRTYTATLAAGVVSVEGAALRDPLTWSFSTASPVIRTSVPGEGQSQVPLETDIRVIFNTPMDQEITASVFSVSDETGAVVPGVITWEDNGAELVFTPLTNLNLGARYTVQVGARARAATSAPLENPQQWTFTTVLSPTLVSSVPRDGATGVDVAEPLRLTFAGALDVATLDRHIIITPTVENVYTNFDAAANVYYLSWNKQPQTEYCVLLKPGIADVYGNVITESRRSCFVTGDLPAFIGPAGSASAVTLDASQPSRLYFLLQNAGRVAFTLSEVAEPDFVRGQDVAGVVIREWQETFSVPRNTPTVVPLVLRRLGGALPTGYYHLAWANPPWGTQSLAFAVVDRHLTLKLTAAEALVWVTDLRSGEPISRTAVRLVDGEGVLVAAGTTDDDGLAQIPISPREDLWTNVAAVVGEPGAAGFGVALTSWVGEAAPSAFGVALDGSVTSPFILHLYTERANYGPGEAVHFRGIVREKDDRYLMPALDTPVQVTLREAAGREVYSTTLALSDMGTFTGTLTLPDGLEAGNYVLVASLPGDSHHRPATAAFAVVAPPQTALTIRVLPVAAEVLRGETISAVISVDDAFGLPVAGAPLTWTVYAQGKSLSVVPFETWEWPGTPAGDPVLVAAGEAETDAEGRFALALPTEAAAPSSGPQRWIITAAVRDEAAQKTHLLPVSGEGQVTVHSSRFYLGIQPREWVSRAGLRTEVNLLAQDWAQQPVAEQEIAVSLTRREWYRVSGVGGATWGYTDTVVSTARVTTNFEGRASAEVIPPHSGTYIVAADALDADNYPVHIETMLWVSGEGMPSWPLEADQVLPKADKRMYNVGDRAKILLPVTFDGPYQMLMTVERDGILTVERRNFDAPNPVVEIPITEAYVPNVYVSFVLIRGITETLAMPEIRAGYVTLHVAPAAQTLTITASTDKPVYRPGDTVSLHVRVVDAVGRPAPAEVTVALVDKALLSRGGSVPSLRDAFYGVHPLQVMTGDGLLVLSGRREVTSLPAEISSRSAHFGNVPFGEGIALPWTGGERFADAVWVGDSRTDVSGEANLTFVLPDTPATWVAVVYALTAETKVGETQVAIDAEKPLRLQPIMPRFLVAGDQVEVAALLSNHTDAPFSGAVQLMADVGARVDTLVRTFDLPARGQARVTWTVSVAESSTEALTLTFTATGGGYREGTSVQLPVYRYVLPDAVGTAGVLGEAETRVETVLIPPEAGDASTLLIRVAPSSVGALVDTLTYLDRYPYASTDVLIERFTSYVFTYRVLQELGVTDDALMARLHTSIVQSLAQLYARQNVDGSWGWWGAENTRTDLARTEFALHLTAFATLGLVKAERAGFAVRPEVQERALGYIYDTIAGSLSGGVRYASHALGLYVLSEAHVPWPTGAGGVLYADREALGVIGRAYLALALGTSDPSDSRLLGLLDRVRSEVELSAAGAHWAGDADLGTGDGSDLHWNTEVVVTSVAIAALARFSPDDPLLAQAAHWLMVTRRGGRWQTTYETAWAIAGLSDVLRVSPDITTTGASRYYDWSVTLNGVALTENVERPAASNDEVVVPWRLRLGLSTGSGGDRTGSLPSLLRDRPNLVEISRGSGAGYLYYTVHPELSIPVGQIAAESRGVTLRREYCAVAEAPLENRVAVVPTACRPLTEVRVGDQVAVRLTLIIPQKRTYVRLEIPHPAGFVPADMRSRMATGGVSQQDSSWWTLPFEHWEVLDERVVLFASEMPPGTYQVTYVLRAVTPGVYGALPAVVSEIYFPEVWGRSAGDVIRVAP